MTGLQQRINAFVGSQLSRRLPSGMLGRATCIAGLVTLAILALMLLARPVLDAVDHWTADFRTAFFTYQLDTQHKRVAFVYIDEAVIAEAQKDAPTRYRSPIDRGMLAAVVRRLDQLGAKAVGLDVVVDQASEAAKDAALVQALKSARSQIVLAQLDFTKLTPTPEQRDYHTGFITGTGRPGGYITARWEADGVVRMRPDASGTTATFPELIAAADGWVKPRRTLSLFRPSDRIAWLRGPKDGTQTFLEVPAFLLLTGPQNDTERALLAQLADKLVVLGVRFQDRTDRHETPLSKGGEEMMPGALIHANVVAQLIDRRSYIELSRLAELALCFATAFAGALIAWRWAGSGWVLGSVPLAAFVAVTVVLFWAFKLILPFAVPLLAWAGAVYMARSAGPDYAVSPALARKEVL